MPPFRPSSIRLASTTASKPTSRGAALLAKRQQQSAPSSTAFSTLPFPVIPTCPSPSCACAPTPSDLDIDHKTPLNGSMAPYTSHILVATGQTDWTSRIEDETINSPNSPWASFISDLKSVFGRRGSHHDPNKNVLISACSLEPISGHSSGSNARTALLFPGLKEISLPVPPSSSHPSSFDSERDLDFQDFLAQATSPATTTTNTPASSGLKTTTLTSPTILVCSHNSRDTRCGILGPLLIDQFRSYLLPLSLLHNSTTHPTGIRVGGISHVGGHKWAGNVIVYIPENWPLHHPSSVNADVLDGTPHQVGEEKTISPLAGKGIWYGRVEPRHVPGIVEATVLQGKVIKELVRGVVDEEGRTIRV